MTEQPRSKPDKPAGCFLSGWGIGGVIIGVIVGFVRNMHEPDPARLIGAVLWNVTLCTGMAVFIGLVFSLLKPRKK